MLIDFDTIDENSKLWIYPSSRKFYPQEIPEIEEKIKDFLHQWKSDDKNFGCSYQLKYNRFIIIVADDSKSPLKRDEIDASVTFILQLETAYDVTLLDKMNVCFKQGEYVQYKELKEFKKLLKSNTITKNTIIFDNTILNKKDLENYWEIPIEDSWYNRFL